MVVNCFPPSHSVMPIYQKNKQTSIMHVASPFLSSVKNAYIPAMRVLSRIHSSCALNMSIFEICRKGKVTFSLAASTAGK